MSGQYLGVATSKPDLEAVTVSGTAAFNGNVAIGDSSADLVGFHGATAVAQASAIATVASGTAVTTATYGIPTPDITEIFACLNSILTVLRNKGLIAP